MKLANIKKGPTIKYFCDNCSNLLHNMYYCTCREESSIFIIGVSGSYLTPNNCPYLLKTERKLKLNRINDTNR